MSYLYSLAINSLLVVSVANFLPFSRLSFHFVSGLLCGRFHPRTGSWRGVRGWAALTALVSGWKPIGPGRTRARAPWV